MGFDTSRRIDFKSSAPGAADAANDTLVAGESKAQVQATFGRATSIRFDTGYEVWSYRYGKATEFSVLFSPSGVVEKTRLRPA